MARVLLPALCGLIAGCRASSPEANEPEITSSSSSAHDKLAIGVTCPSEELDDDYTVTISVQGPGGTTFTAVVPVQVQSSAGAVAAAVQEALRQQGVTLAKPIVNHGAYIYVLPAGYAFKHCEAKRRGGGNEAPCLLVVTA